MSAPATLPAHDRSADSTARPASDIQRKIDNTGACSHLDCAIWFIRQANKLWPFQHAAGLIETIEQLKAKLRDALAQPVTSDK